MPGKRECDDTVVRRAQHIIVDDREQATRFGELQHHTKQGHHHLLELGALLLDTHRDITPPSGIRLCDLTRDS